MARRIYKFKPSDYAGSRDRDTFLKAVHGLEGSYAQGNKARNLIDPNKARIDEIIAGDVRPEVFDILGGGEKGDLAKKLHGLDTHTKDKKLGSSLVGRLFGKNPNKYFTREQPPISGSKDFKGGKHDAHNVSANREVIAPVIYDPEHVWDNAILNEKNGKIKKLLAKHISSIGATEPESDPTFIYAVNFLLQKFRKGVKPPDTVPKALDCDSAYKILEGVFGLKHVDADPFKTKENLDELKSQYGEITEVAKKIREIIKRDTIAAKLASLQKKEEELGPNDFGTPASPGKLKTAQGEFTAAESAYKTATGTSDKTLKQNDLAVARENLQKAQTNYDDAKKKHSELKDLVDKFADVGKEFNVNTQRLKDPDPADSHFTEAKEKIKALSDDLAANKMDDALGKIENKSISDEWRKYILPRAEAIHKEEEEKGGDHHEAGKISSEEFLYKIYNKYITTKKINGGGAEDTDPVGNTVFLHKKRQEAALFTRFAISDAKDMSVFAANRARAEALAKKLPKDQRAKFLPDFDQILEAFKFINAGETRPFAKLNLKKDTSRAEIRYMIKHGELKESDIPLLIGHVQKVLEGHENTFVKAEDIPFVMAMIRNLRLVREEMRFNTIMKKPGKFDDKLKELMAEDNTIDEARDSIDEAGLFAAITDKKFVKGQKEIIVEGIKERVRSGELSIKDAMKELKDNGIDAGRWTWAKLVAARTGSNIGNTWKNLKGRGPFAWAGRKIKGGWANTKGAGSWLKNSFLGKAISYSFNPKTMKDNYSIIPPFLKGGGHGHGDHGGGHGGGDAHGGAAKH